MILFYIDESGTGLKDTKTHFFVLSAFAIYAKDWKQLDQEIIALKRRLINWAQPEDFEIKGRDMRRGEQFFKSLNWEGRKQAMNDVAKLIASVPCKVFTVQVDKRTLPNSISSDDQLYRIAFWRLLDMLEGELNHMQEPGMLMADMRTSTIHSSVQDRRLIDAFRNWLERHSNQTFLIELPWFGFSEFYAGLQMADFTAYIIDSVSNEGERGREMQAAFEHFRDKVQIAYIP